MSENDEPKLDSQDNNNSQPIPNPNDALPDDVLPDAEPNSQINFKADSPINKHSFEENNNKK